MPELDRLPANNSGVLATIDAATIINRYLEGETTNQIAASLGCTRQGLGWHLRHKAEGQWKDAQVILALERKEKAEEDLASACDALSLARAREQLRSAQWDLERVLKRIFGPSAEQLGKDGGPLTVRIIQFGETIDASQQDITDAQVIEKKP